MIVDVHTHLDHPLLEKDLDEIIKRAKKAGISAIITNGISKESNRRVLDISKKYDIVKASLGIYPQDALRKETSEEGYAIKTDFDTDAEIKFIEKNKNKIIAIGEVGLDYYNGKDKIAQKEVFIKIIDLAKKINKPIIVHSRKAENDVIDLLEEKGAKKVILHCFSGKKRLIIRASKLGYSFSIPANIVRAQNFQMLVTQVPLSQILTETDAPYLSPYKDKINEPAFVHETIKRIAEIKQIEEKEAENIIYMNYMKLFL